MKRTPPPAAMEDATLSEVDGVRYLHLGTPWVQGAMRIARPDRIELDYVRRMMVWLVTMPAERWAGGHAVQLGLGAGAITRCCRQVLGLRCTAVECNPSVVAVCHAAFRLPRADPGLQVLTMDAAAYAADPAGAGTADVLCVDLYDHDAASPVLDSDDFYRDCHRLLGDGGTMTVNLFGRSASLGRSSARIADAFGGDAHIATVQPTRQGNTVVVAMKGYSLADRETLLARAGAVERQHHLPATAWVKMLRRGLPTEPT